MATYTKSTGYKTTIYRGTLSISEQRTIYTVPTGKFAWVMLLERVTGAWTPKVIRYKANGGPSELIADIYTDVFIDYFSQSVAAAGTMRDRMLNAGESFKISASNVISDYLVMIMEFNPQV